MRIFSTTFGKETKFRVSLGMLMLLLLTTATVNGQTGYIYVHKKALNEVNKNFTFSVTGGTTSIPTFTLNDEPTQISAFFDIGASPKTVAFGQLPTAVLYITVMLIVPHGLQLALLVLPEWMEVLVALAIL